MKKLLAKSLIVIIEAGLEVMAERIKERRSKIGNREGLDHLSGSNGAYEARDLCADRPYSLRNWQALKRNANAIYRGIRQKTKKGVAQ